MKTLTALCLTALSLASPASAGTPEVIGAGCGGSRSHAGSHSALITGGPIAAADVSDDDGSLIVPDGAPTTITLHCWYQATPDLDHTSALSGAHCHETGTNAVALACTMAFQGPERVYLCSLADLTYGDQSRRFVFDADGNPANGEQCSG